jgi:hypothetical protein
MSPPPESSGLVVFGYVPLMPFLAFRGSEEISFCGCDGSSSLYFRLAARARTLPLPGSTAAISSAFLFLSPISSVMFARAAVWALMSSVVVMR